MKRSMLKRTALRDIRQTFGRFMAILAIMALGVGFFSGVRETTPSMVNTMNRFLEEQQFYDYRLISSMGWDKSAVEAFRDRADVRFAEGSSTLDVLWRRGDTDHVLKTHMMPENINGIELTEGRLPQNNSECVIDADTWLKIGDKISISEENSDSVSDMFKVKEFTVVGRAYSSQYINFERGSTSIGNGDVSGFVYIPESAYDSDYYTEIFIRFDHSYEIYSQEYKDMMDSKEAQWEELAQAQADARYNRLYSDARAELDEGYEELENSRNDGENQLSEAKVGLDAAKAELNAAKAQLDEQAEMFEGLPEGYASGNAEFDAGLAAYRQGLADYESGLADYETGLADYEASEADLQQQIANAEADLAEGENQLNKLKKPTVYLMNRNTNIGYACFESDSEIVEQVARVFPVFFILVAALVCITTMSRMVEEQRTQIGMLKALGYSRGRIMGKFMFYSGAASIIGCLLGFFAGTYTLPQIIWITYRLMYIELEMSYFFDPVLCVLTAAAALVCSLGTTWISCRVELSETAASLMRPKAPKAGKRVFLERIGFIWNRMKFLHKVSVRNIFRYKGRFFMMIVGIGGCTALLLTGFGLKDSIAGFAQSQYDNVEIADGQAYFNSSDAEKAERTLAEKAEKYAAFHTSAWDILYGDHVKSISLNVAEDFSAFEGLADYHGEDGERLTYPGVGEAVVSQSVCERYGAEPGKTVTLRNGDMEELRVKVTGVFENHVYNYVVISGETYRSQLGRTAGANTAYVNLRLDGRSTEEAAAELSKMSEISAFSNFNSLKERLSGMMNSLNYIVLVIIVCAAGLAFIVIYNLTNINITERTREIATIKVLGFTRRESSAYVLRENLALTAIGVTAGCIAGIFLHKFVMGQIVVDMVHFSVRIEPVSFVFSIVLTFLFNMAVNLFMNVKLERINMAESLKEID